MTPIDRNGMRRNDILVYLSGVKKIPHYQRGLLTFRVFGLSKLIKESRLADSNHFPAPATSALLAIWVQPNGLLAKLLPYPP